MGITMKRIRIFLPLLGIIFLLLSCSSDDNGDDEPEISPAVGTWNLFELNINPPQDIDMDGNPTDNILDELPCVTGSLTIREDGTWNSTIENLAITSVTGGLFFINCSGTASQRSGTWLLQGSQLTLFQGFGNLLFTLEEDTLILSSNEDLPGFRSEVYQRQ